MTAGKGQATRQGSERAVRRFAAVAAVGMFVLIAGGIASLGGGAKSELDGFLKRTRGQRIGLVMTSAQSGYTFETRRNGAIVPTSLADLGARRVFLNFWGTFCPPCIEELPSLLARARAAEGTLFVAVSYDESWQVIDDFFRKFTTETLPPNFLVVRDPERVAGRDLKAQFGTEKLPESYLLRDGIVEAKFVSGRDWGDPDIAGLFNLMGQ